MSAPKLRTTQVRRWTTAQSLCWIAKTGAHLLLLWAAFSTGDYMRLIASALILATILVEALSAVAKTPVD
ncbi:MAG: hypothetical protein KDA51_18925 [Planctomycetales bacterium]|nr:hypothetical protein [Planctomycetota bacterium]MCA9183546.1 hypothetical protein [Planctomycetales bacterium]